MVFDMWTLRVGKAAFLKRSTEHSRSPALSDRNSWLQFDDRYINDYRIVAKDSPPIRTSRATGEGECG